MINGLININYDEPLLVFLNKTEIKTLRNAKLVIFLARLVHLSTREADVDGIQ